VIQPFISEIHYDNDGSDRGEFIAVTAAAGVDLFGWQLVLYNGATGGAYESVDLTGTVMPSQPWGELAWSVAGLQNGPDAVALV
jgi:hypothetical protein